MKKTKELLKEQLGKLCALNITLMEQAETDVIIQDNLPYLIESVTSSIVAIAQELDMQE